MARDIAIDSSALVAILANEPECDTFLEVIAHSGRRMVSAAALLETRIVRYGKAGAPADVALKAFLGNARIEIVPVNEAMADLAFDAFRRFGKGVGKPAVLNFGDCFSYALARSANVPLLFKGDDFALTDIAAA